MPNRLLQVEVALFKKRNFDHITGGDFYKQDLALGYLTDGQHIVIYYGGAAGGAKSFTGCEWLMFMCLSYPGTKWFIGRAELKRLRESTLVTFFKTAQKHGLQQGVDYRYNGQDHFILFSNGSRIDLLDLQFKPSDPMYERFGSTEYTGGWIEEGGEIHVMAKEVLKTRIGRHMNEIYGILRKLLITCNPKKNWIYTEGYKPMKEGTLPNDTVFIVSLVTDNPFIDKGYIDNLKQIKDPILRARLFEGNFEYDDDPYLLMKYDSIVDMFTTRGKEDPYRKYLICDYARFGTDSTVIGYWEGLQLKEVREYKGKNTKEIAKVLDTMAIDYGVQRSMILVDENGVGSGVVDQLPGCKGFYGSASIIQPREAAYDVTKKVNFLNLRTQCYFMLADKVNSGDVGIDEIPLSMKEAIIQECEQVKQINADHDGKVQMVKKEDVKESIGRSPDYSDMLSMRMYFELNKPAPVVKTPKAAVPMYHPLTGQRMN